MYGYKNSNIDYSGRLDKLMNDDSFIRELNRIYYKIYTYRYKYMDFSVCLN